MGQHGTGRSRPWRGAVPLVFVAAGVLFATSAGTAAGTDLREEGPNLPDLVRQEAAAVDERSAAVAALRAEVETLSAGLRDAGVSALRDEASTLAGPAQVQAVTGPGVTVVLDDAPADRPLPLQAGPDDVVVHQQDVEGVVNALWAGGAEAMMIMDQRIVSTSAVRCVGTTLHLQGRVYSPPYVITALGSPEALLAALDDDPAVTVYRQYVRAFDLGYDVSEDDDISLPAYDGPLDLRYARVAGS